MRTDKHAYRPARSAHHTPGRAISPRPGGLARPNQGMRGTSKNPRPVGRPKRAVRMPDSAREPLLIAPLLELAADPDPVELMARLTRHSLRLPGAQAGAVLLADAQGQLQEMAASSESAERLERLQIEHGEGPSLDAHRSGTSLSDLPLSHPHCRARWPHFAPRALAEGFTAITAVPVRHKGRTFGALNLFHQHRRLGPAGIRACQTLTDAAALGLAHQRTVTELRERNAHLQAALESRIAIEQAKGVLAERLRLAPDDSFDRMRRHARAHHQKLTDLADQIIHKPAQDTPFPVPAVTVEPAVRGAQGQGVGARNSAALCDLHAFADHLTE